FAERGRARAGRGRRHRPFILSFQTCDGRRAFVREAIPRLLPCGAPRSHPSRSREVRLRSQRQPKPFRLFPDSPAPASPVACATPGRGRRRRWRGEQNSREFSHRRHKVHADRDPSPEPRAVLGIRTRRKRRELLRAILRRLFSGTRKSSCGFLPRGAAFAGCRPCPSQSRATGQRATVPARRRNLRRPFRRSYWRARHGAVRLLPAGRRVAQDSRGKPRREGNNPRRRREYRRASVRLPTKPGRRDDRAGRSDECVLRAEREMHWYPYFFFPYLPRRPSTIRFEWPDHKGRRCWGMIRLQAAENKDLLWTRGAAPSWIAASLFGGAFPEPVTREPWHDLVASVTSPSRSETAGRHKTMKGDAKVIEQLNQALGAEMTAIVQYRTFRVTANFSAKAFWLWGCSR